VITRVTLAQRRTERNIILGAAALLYAASLVLPPEEKPPPPPPPAREWVVPVRLAEGIDYSDEVRPYREPLEYYDEH
jgi:hypothetical protein